MNCFQRSTRIEASFSGVLVQVAARTGTMPDPDNAAVAPTPTFRMSRLLNLLIFFFLLVMRFLDSLDGALFAETPFASVTHSAPPAQFAIRVACLSTHRTDARATARA